MNVIPSLVARDFGRDSHVRPVFLLDEDVDRIRRAVYTRGLWDDASRYPDHVKEKEVEWVQAYNRLLVADAERSELPVVRVDKTDTSADSVLSTLGLG